MINFSLTQLEYVLAVHQHGSFSAAAKSCHVTQPTLSMQVQKLEQDLGAVIFDRSLKPILLTAQGEVLLEQMRGVVFEARKLQSLAEAATSKTIKGQLTLGVIPTVAPYLLPRLLPVMERDYPGIQLQLLEMQTQQILAAVNHDEIHGGILALPLEHKHNNQETLLYAEDFSLLCHKDHRFAQLPSVPVQDLRPQDLWLLEDGHCLGGQVLSVCSLAREFSGDQPGFRFKGGSLETLKNLVDRCGGYTLLPALACSGLGSDSRLLPLEQPAARGVGMLFARKHYKQELREAVEAAVMAAVPVRLRDLDNWGEVVIPVRE